MLTLLIVIALMILIGLQFLVVRDYVPDITDDYKLTARKAEIGIFRLERFDRIYLSKPTE